MPDLPRNPVATDDRSYLRISQTTTPESLDNGSEGFRLEHPVVQSRRVKRWVLNSVRTEFGAVEHAIEAEAHVLGTHQINSNVFSCGLVRHRPGDRPPRLCLMSS